MKKIISVSLIISILISMLIIFSGCSNNSNEEDTMKENTSVIKETEYNVIYDGYISNFESEIIKNVDEYNNLKNNLSLNDEVKASLDSKKYDDTYFNDKSLAIIYITTGSSANEFLGLDLEKNDTILTVKPNIEYARGITTTDITGKLILIEIDKSIEKIEITK